MAWIDRLRVGFRSFAGRRGYVTILLKPEATQGQAETLLANLAAFSKGHVFHATREVQVIPATATLGAAGPYATHRDVMRLRLGCADGSRLPLDLPCVREALLQADTQTLDWTEAEVTALVNAMKPIVLSDSGALVTELQAGWRDYVKPW